MNVANSRPGARDNAFGLLRLLFASLVIVSHAPELVDGDRSRELLTGVFHSLSFGELAVDGFFIVSGMLITGSILRHPSPLAYLGRRIARIHPAFAVASILCLLLAVPLAGGHYDQRFGPTATAAILRMLILSPPVVPGAFAGSPYPLLNGAAWTLQYEFLCYLLILIAAPAGLFRSFARVAGAALACLALCTAMQLFLPDPNVRLWQGQFLQGTAFDLPRLVGLFLSGSAMHVAGDRIGISAVRIGGATLGLIVSLFFPAVAHLGVAVFGTYLIHAVAVRAGGNPLARAANRTDISYGLYLYAWPIQLLLMRWRVSDDLLVLGLLTWMMAAALGAASWFAIERNVMRRVTGATPRRSSTRRRPAIAVADPEALTA